MVIDNGFLAGITDKESWAHWKVKGWSKGRENPLHEPMWKTQLLEKYISAGPSDAGTRLAAVAHFFEIR